MKVDKNEFYREVTSRICGSLDIEQAFSNMFEYFKQFIPVDAMAVGYSDMNKKRIISVARIEPKGAHVFGYEKMPEIPLDEEYVSGLRVIESERINVIMANRPEDQSHAFIRIFPKLSSYSYLILNLFFVHRHAIYGLLLAAKGFDRYSQDHAALLESVKEPIAIAMSNAHRYLELVHSKDLLAENNKALTADIKRSVGVEVIGADFGLREVMEQVRLIAPSSSPTLLLGETGTGKEVIANAIHMASPKHKGPMISIQCGAIPEALLGSELFGHEKGAFTGAFEQKRGRFELAKGGTLFLDEIGELSPEAQVKLLRVLQENRFERVGGTQTIEVDVRVIAATHRDLDRMVREGKFREDLWYRLNVLPIRIPPLRLRREDIPSLVRYFVERKAQEMNLLRTPQIDTQSLERLKSYDWPGNVRELQNIVERALILSHGGRLRFPELNSIQEAPERQRPTRNPETMQTMDHVMANHIRKVLKHTDGQINGPGGAAEILQMNPSTLRFRIKKLGIRRKIAFTSDQ